MTGDGQALDSAISPNPKPIREAIQPQFGPHGLIGSAPAV